MSESSIDFHQQRGLAADIIKEALNSYREFMLDDNYDAMTCLHDIMGRMQKRSDALWPTLKEPCGECHLQPNETCDICGAKNRTLKEPKP